jgi:probable rRNA maturation factor
MELDLALDAAGPWSPEDPSSLIENQTWQTTLIDWIQTICANPSLPCPALVCHAEEVSLGLRFTDDATITALNSTWRQRNQATDVLSFAALEEAPDLPDVSSVELGDIVISLDTARRQASEQGHNLTQELRWLVSHGLLHLLGWDHPDEDSLEAMLQLQEQLLDGGGNVRISDPHSVDITVDGNAH